MTTWDDIAAERRELADLYAGLSDKQLNTPSLCGAWTVRDLLAHLCVPFEVSMPQFGLAMLRARGSFGRANRALTAQLAARPTAELVDLLRTNAEHRFTPPGGGELAPLAEILVHGQDARIPLGVSDLRDPATWEPALVFLVSPQGRRGFVPRPLPRAVRLVATDVDWGHGSGEAVEGPGAAIALALCGRPAGLPMLSGAGVGTLRAWIG